MKHCFSCLPEGSFDMVCKTMLETGRDLNESYRETAEGGLAKTYRK